MSTRPRPANAPIPPELEAEHRALKEQTAVLRREHDRLHNEGGTKEEHQQHIRKLRTKIKELERHVERLKNLRNPRN
jgi:predicted nuclease with TOPRIM domain